MTEYECTADTALFMMTDEQLINDYGVTIGDNDLDCGGNGVVGDWCQFCQFAQALWPWERDDV